MLLSGGYHEKEHYLNMFLSEYFIPSAFRLFMFDGQNRICIVIVTDYDLIMMQ